MVIPCVITLIKKDKKLASWGGGGIRKTLFNQIIEQNGRMQHEAFIDF
jgi:hypothetical protein